MSRRPATDYSSAMAHWVLNRRPQNSRYNGFEVERPSPSYVIDVCTASLILSIASDPRLCDLVELTNIPDAATSS